MGAQAPRRAVLLLSDGQPNRSTTGTTEFCQEADTAATSAKSKGIEIITVGFGLDGGNDIRCPDDSSVWRNQTATDLWATMATRLGQGRRLSRHREFRRRRLLVPAQDARRQCGPDRCLPNGRGHAHRPLTLGEGGRLTAHRADGGQIRVKVMTTTPTDTAPTPAHWRGLMRSPSVWAMSAAMTANCEDSTAVTAIDSAAPQANR